MKIAFFGDSLTVGIPGASYYEILCRKLPEHELVRYARGGDSVVDAYQRISKLTFDGPFDVAFLWIGVNDVFVKLSWTYPIIRTILRQRWIKNVDEFSGYYRTILDLLRCQAEHVRAVSPLFLGENIDNRWNQELGELSAIIETLSAEYSNVEYVDLRGVFETELASMASSQVSGYLPTSAIRIGLDAVLLKGPTQIDHTARARGLHFTLDGAHLNSRGATIVAEAFVEAVKGVIDKTQPGSLVTTSK